MLRVVVIGCGHIARQAHLPALLQLQQEGLVTVQVADADAGRARALAEQFQVPHVADWTSVADELDAAVVCAPPGANADVAVSAVERGLHVLCEKPPGRSAAQARRMADAAAARPDLVDVVGFNRRFNPVVDAAITRSRALGPPQSFFGRFSRKSLGGVPSNTASDWLSSDSIHVLDLAVAVMGFPHAVAVAHRNVGGGADNVWSLQLHTDHGSAALYFDYAAGSRVEVAEWTGPGYDVIIDFPADARWGRDNTWTPFAADADAAFHEANGFLGEHRAFVDAIAGSGPRPTCDFAYGARLMRMIGDLLDAPSGTIVPVRPDADVREEVHVRAAPRRRRPRVVLHQPLAAQPRFFAPDDLADLAERADVTTAGPDESLGDADVLVTGRGAPPIPPERLDAATNLELLVVLGSSVERYEPVRLIERGIAVCNTADGVAVGVAEHCLMVTLAGLRKLPQHDAAMHAGRWGLGAKKANATPSPGGGPKPTGRGGKTGTADRPGPVAAAMDVTRRVLPAAWKARLYERSGFVRARAATPASQPQAADPLQDLRGAVVGLIGWGHVARRFAELLRPFGCTVLVASESAPPDALAAVGARRAPLSEILEAARVISMHRGLTEETRATLGADQLARIRPGAVLVNTARGPLIDEAALVDHLRLGVTVAALDVFDDEPLPEDHPLRSLPNAILTPHNASTTAQESRRIGHEALGYVMAWVAGDAVPALDAERLRRMT